MARPTFSINDEDLDELDDLIFEKKVEGDLPRDATRSEVLRELALDWIESQGGEVQGNTSAESATAN
ncbi:CopG family ribbon-helix-helix protein [Halococcus sp. AFM35]|uniref:CopG family ribbon-helix-helix protein n=1 Tax=Halococcus sp. AFM35 TaxID=3421653 RepID=UPI003EBF0A42